MNSTEVEAYGYDPCQDLLAFTQYHGNNHDDFQLMAEFHEQIGPNPVFMIPDKPAGIDHFDINSFAVCLLSKDVQESANGFKAGRGSQTVIHFTCPGFRSYVFAYYFALCDIHARGYMRQFCMTFVSPDRDKLMHNFVPMKAKFDEVAAFLCHGNHKMFLKDVKKRLKDLNHTLAILEHSNAVDNEETDGQQLPSAQAAEWKDALDGNLDSVRASIEEMEEIKLDLEKEMKDPKYAEVEHHLAALRFFAPEENTAVALRRKQPPSDCITPDSSPNANRSVLRHDSKRFERKLRFLSELAPRTYGIAYSKLEALHKEFSPSSLHLTVREMEGPLFQDTASVIAIGNVPVLSFASDTGEGEEEFRTPHGSPQCVFSDEEAGDDMRLRLDSDGSMVIVSALSSPLEGNDRGLDVGGDVKGPLVTASSDTHFTSHSKDSPVEDRHLLSDVRDDGQPSPAVDVTQPPLAVDSVDKLSSSMDDVCQLPPSINGVAKPASSDDAIIGYKGNGSSEGEGTTNPHTLSSSVDEAEVDRGHTSVEHPQVESNSPVPILVESAVDLLTAPGGYVRRGPLQLVINDDSSNSLSESEFTTPAEDKTIFFSEPRVYREHTQPWHYYTEHIFNITGLDKRRAGKNIFAFCRHHGAVKDILYALLRGRTLVILGKQKKQVQGFIQTLCLFVPGSGREHKVCQWLDGQEGQDRGGGRFPWSAATKQPAAEETLLCMSHLQDYKLIGMNSAYSIPKQLLGIVSSWDIDTGRLQTPVYTGKLLYSIASRIKSEKSEEEFVARIHSVFVELAMKAFTYYHALMKDRLEKSRDLTIGIKGFRLLYLHKPGYVCTCWQESAGERLRLMKESRRVLGLLNSGSDSDIVKYLSSIVISQQLVEAGLRTAKPYICVTFKPNKRIECKASYRQYQF